MSKYDDAVESLLSAIQGLRGGGARQLLAPIFVFSKFDLVKPDVLRAANVAAAPPGVRDNRPRATYAEALLDRNLPRTLATVRASEKGRLGFARPAYFFSWVRIEGTSPGQPERIRLRRSGVAGWGPDYSGDECLAFLEYLGGLAARSGS